jgi:hypothetical protein
VGEVRNLLKFGSIILVINQEHKPPPIDNLRLRGKRM